MIIIVTILVIAATIIAYINYEWDSGTVVVSALCSIGLVIFDIILIVICIVCGASAYTIDDKITMYQEENTKIEEQMTTIVQNYQGYEKEVVSNIADMEVMLIKFPELKTSELVKTQMNVYIENNNKIKELKEEQINNRVGKWLLYFGK